MYFCKPENDWNPNDNEFRDFFNRGLPNKVGGVCAGSRRSAPSFITREENLLPISPLAIDAGPGKTDHPLLVIKELINGTRNYQRYALFRCDEEECRNTRYQSSADFTAANRVDLYEEDASTRFADPTLFSLGQGRAVVVARNNSNAPTVFKIEADNSFVQSALVESATGSFERNAFAKSPNGRHLAFVFRGRYLGGSEEDNSLSIVTIDTMTGIY